MINKILATLAMWLLAVPIFLPWLLARLSVYKRWYFAPFIPPFSWRGWIQLWPLSAFFICIPFLALTPLSDDMFMKSIVVVGVLGVIGAFVIVVWTPGWAKPAWQRRLEDRFSHEQISAFISVWRKMPFSQWSDMIETEEGMLELADYAIENHARHVDDVVRLRARQLTNAKKRRLKQKPKWLFQD